MCVNQHDPEAVEVRPDGRRVCTKCVKQYSARLRLHGAARATRPRPTLRKDDPNHDKPLKS